MGEDQQELFLFIEVDSICCKSRNQEGDHHICRILPFIVYAWYYIYRRNKLNKISEFCKAAMLTVWHLVPGKQGKNLKISPHRPINAYRPKI